MREEKQTLLDLYVGIAGLSFILVVAGACIVENKLPFILGVLYGGIVAAVLVSHMYRGLWQILAYDENGAQKQAQKQVGIRMWIMLAAVAVAMYFNEYFQLIGVVLGILTLKVSAYMQPFVHRRITSKFYEKRRVKL